jgi:uncharacterized protein
MEETFKKIKEIVEVELAGECSAHDMDHVMRVHNLAMAIARSEADVDLQVLRAAALLHDIGGAKEANDPSGQTDHAVVSAEMAELILEELGFAQGKICHIQDCIRSHRYRTDHQPQTIEAKILFDADKLDAAGAIGMARTLAWIGKHKAKIYKKADIDEYIKENQGGKLNGRIQDKSKHSPHINYEVKDKFLMDKLHTETAKRIGQERMAFYKEFLDRMEKEVNGEL